MRYTLVFLLAMFFLFATLIILPVISKSVAIPPESKPEDFINLTQTQQIKILADLGNTQGVKSAWIYLLSAYNYDKVSSNPHDLAHFLGGLIYQKEGLDGLIICDSSFAFGCYHGFTEAAFTNNLDLLKKIEEGCGQVGKIGSGPFASCIHGIGHGIASFHNESDLQAALGSCDELQNGQTYCYDGVLMEFMTNAPRTIYQKTSVDPLYPCTELNPKYKGPCARNQPQVMIKYLGLKLEDISKICLSSDNGEIRFHCIDSVSLNIGQRSFGKIEFILQNCMTLFADEAIRSQCVAAAAGEVVFQKYPDWQETALKSCDSLSPSFQKSCKDRVQQIITSYR